MPCNQYSLEAYGPARLKISWDEVYYLGVDRNIVITLDGIQIGMSPTRDELIEGREFILQDGSKLFLQLQNLSLFVKYQDTTLSSIDRNQTEFNPRFILGLIVFMSTFVMKLCFAHNPPTVFVPLIDLILVLVTSYISFKSLLWGLAFMDAWAIALSILAVERGWGLWPPPLFMVLFFLVNYLGILAILKFPKNWPLQLAKYIFNK